MSVGRICNCPRHRCDQYSADQHRGGLCGSCRLGYHAPCDRPAPRRGTCRVCLHHGSTHAKHAEYNDG